MKKLLLFLSAVCFFASALRAEEAFAAGFWFDVPVGTASASVGGVGLGIPVISNRNTSGLSLALCGNHTRNRMEGFQFALIGFNYAGSLEGVQLAFVNIQDGQHGKFTFQWGFYNQAAKNGIQVGFLNNGQNNATFQLGLLNINKNGLLPFMIFVNFGRDLFK